MEGEVDFVNRETKAVGRNGWQGGDARLRNPSAGEGQHRKDQQIAYGRFIEHVLDLSGI
jgi:hypothetical protein